MRKISKVFASTVVFVIISSMLLVSIPEVQAQFDWGQYHRYAEIVAGLENLGSSDVAQVETIGVTYHGIEIKAIKISDNAHVDEMGEPDILFVGLHHAREWISAEVPYYLAVNLVQRYDTDSTVKALVDGSEIWVVPVLNPDGYWWSHEYDRYWRKNTRPVGVDIWGVDLNRNYGFMWGQDLDPGVITDGSPNPEDPTYWGPNPFSENETSAIRDLLTDPQHNFEAVLSYHSYGQLVLYPWAYTEESAPDSVLMSTLAAEMADIIYNVHGETYIPMQASELYLVSGDLADWVYGTMGIPAFTIELRPESADPWWLGFELPKSEILGTCEENWPAALHLINYVSERDRGDLPLEGERTWYWVDDTYIVSVAVGDVDGDPAMEIVTGGYYFDGTRERAQLAVWNGATLTLEGVTTWYWGWNTGIESVAVGDVDGDGATEIVTGGWHWDGNRWVAQLAVWDGATLALEDVTTWYWWSHTVILSVACADADGDGAMEIVTGGYYNDFTRDRAQLAVWDGATLALEDVMDWYWFGDTYVKSVAVGEADGDAGIEIVTGGWYYDGSRDVAQLVVWDGATLALEDVMDWYWFGDTHIESVAVGEIDLSGGREIVTGGWYWDGTRFNAQLVVWNGATLTLDYPPQYWYTDGDTKIYSVAFGDVDGDGIIETVTGGAYYDYDTGYNAQLWVGYFFESAGFKSWGGEVVETSYWWSSTYIASVAIADVDSDGGVEIVTGGAFHDGSRYVAQLAVWTQT